MPVALEPATSENIEPLIADLVAWVAREPRSYTEAMETWRTSCPRLTVWEDACDRGLVERVSDGRVRVTQSGKSYLEQHKRT